MAHRATVGGIFTNLQGGDTYNRVAGVDLRYRFFYSSSFNTWWAAPGHGALGRKCRVDSPLRGERLEESFFIRPEVEVPAGDYTYDYAGFLVRTNDSRELSANGVTHFGDFWNGRWFHAGAGVTWKTGPHLVLNSGYFAGELRDPRDERWLNRAGVVKLTYLKAF